MSMSRAKRELAGVTVCHWCRKPGNADQGPDGRSWHHDHLLPKAHGGSDSPSNIVKSCATCNLKKGPRVWGDPPEMASLRDLVDAQRVEINRLHELIEVQARLLDQAHWQFREVEVMAWQAIGAAKVAR
jgi:5-methylcytosine-specific restriction endonuclease McrA